MRLAAVVTGCLAVYLVLARVGLQAYPLSGDEYSYRLQGEIFARGRLSMPAPAAHARHFEVDHVLLSPTLRSKYPPGWPALLSVGARAGASWIVNPVLGALTLLALFGAARRLYGAGPAFVAVLLLGCSPFFAYNAASYHSHTGELWALSVAFYCCVAGWQSRRAAWGVGAGLALGLAFLIRPVDALAFAPGLVVLLRARPRFVVATAVAGAAVGGLMFPYQAVQFGSPFTSGYEAYNPVLREIYGDFFTHAAGPAYLLSPAAQWGHLNWFGQLGMWMAPGVLLVAAFGLARRWREARETPFEHFLLVVAAMQLLVVLCMSGDMGDSYGPRYLVPLLLPLTLGLAAGLVRGRAWLEARGVQLSPRVLKLGLAAVAACGLLRAGVLLEPHWDEIHGRSGIYRAVA